MAGLTDSVEFERGGFWRRALALMIDAIIVSVILQLLGFALYPLSKGRVQFVSGIALLYCDKLDAVPEACRCRPTSTHLDHRLPARAVRPDHGSNRHGRANTPDWRDHDHEVHRSAD